MSYITSVIRPIRKSCVHKTDFDVDRTVEFFSGRYLAEHFWRRFRLAGFFSADFRQTKIRRLIRLSATAEGPIERG